MIEFRPPRRPLIWPRLVERLAELAPSPDRLFLVGGIVRDALRGTPGRDVDLVTLDDGLDVARRLADSLDGAYYPVDPERRTGRVLIGAGSDRHILDVASLRGDDLLADLMGRDFTINAMVVPLNSLDRLGDPLGGESDLLIDKILRQCSPDSIASDPIRALRAVRLSIQFNLRLEKETLATVRDSGPAMADQSGRLRQPERARDELFKMLGGPRPAGALRLRQQLGLLHLVAPFPLPTLEALSDCFSVIERLHDLLSVIGPERDDNTAADLTLGVAVMILDRHRHALQEHLAQRYGEGRPRFCLSYLVILTLPAGPAPGVWADWLRLTRAEGGILEATHAALAGDLIPHEPPDDLTLHRYYREYGESGIDALLIRLAAFLAEQWPTPDPQVWGSLLDEVTSPALDAFFRRYQAIVAPPPLINGDDLIQELRLKPGPQIGLLLNRLIEAQVTGQISSKKQALRLAQRLAETDLD